MEQALVSIALEKLTSLLEQQLTLFAGAKRELETLKDTFESIQAVLADAESKQVANKSVRLWLSRLRHVAYDMDDVLNEWQALGLEKEGRDNENRVSTCIPSPYTCFDQTVSRYKVARRIQEIRGRLDKIDSDKNRYNFMRSDNLGGNRILVRSRAQTSSLMEESEIIGRNDDKEAVVSKLVNGSNQAGDGQVDVIAIVGIGGLGKTTLARQIYNDGKVQHHFENALYWVCVSEGFDVKGLTKAIIEHVKRITTSFSQLDLLQKELLQAVRGKRFLLVLDDVWNDDASKWDMLQRSLKSGAQESRILVTTRSEKVANAMNAAYVHELQGLTDDQSWVLFSKKAFAGKKVEEYSELESVGRGIVSKCKGVPLSIKVVGSAMNSKRARRDWQDILDSEMWSLPQVTDEILPALLLSYYNLPTHLKQCFAYCSIYQKDQVIVKDRLVKLWFAQGFIQPQGNREMEVIGEEYFDDLVAWSMFQEVIKGKDKETTCKMHDLFHDLAEFLTKDESYIFMSEKSNPCPVNVRHASLYLNYDNSNIPITSRRAKKLRTLFLNEVDKIDKAIVDLFRHARFVKALWLASSTIETLPKTIGKMKHLRYLDLSRSWIVELPESVCDLCNLHTLNLTGCSKLKKLPRGIGGMVSLRHLEMEKTCSLECLPKGLGRISSLRGLCKFIVGGEGGCGIDELQRLNSLQGCLQIDHLERVSSQEEAEKAEIHKKSDLSSLVLRILGRNAEMERMDSVIEGLRPHVNLEVLKLYCYSCSKLPSWMEDSSFSKLTKLEIDGFLHCEQNLPGLGKLPALKCLEIRGVGVRKLGHEMYYGSSSCVVGGRGVAFPKLKELVLYNMEELEEWESTSETDADAIMPCLCILKIWYCPNLEELPHHLAKSPLTALEIKHAFRIKGIGCARFPLLETFTLSDSSEFFSNGLPDLPSLKTFEIGRIRKEKLPNAGWERLVALKALEICECDELESLPDGLTQLQSLESLIISECEKLESLPEGLGQLKKLKSLGIQLLKALTRLPDSLGQLEVLEDLTIVGCEKLYWLGQLKALRCLIISHCEALGSRPHGLQDLSLLQKLDISGCPQLSGRCKKREGGEDWPDISHVPIIYIDHRRI